MEFNILNVVFLSLPTIVTAGAFLFLFYVIFDFIAKQSGKITADIKTVVRKGLIFLWAVIAVFTMISVASNHIVKNKVVSTPVLEYVPQVRDVPDPNSDFLQTPESRFGKFDERISNEPVDK